MEFFSTPDLLEIGGYPFSCNGYKPTREEGIEYYRKVADREGLEYRLYERVERLEGEDGALEVHTDKGVLRARKAIVATGFFDVPHPPDLPRSALREPAQYFNEQ